MGRLLELVRPRMEAIARDYVKSGGAVESVSDLVQEAGLRAWQRLDQFRGGPTDADTEAMFLAWLGQVVRSVGLNSVEAVNAQMRKPPGGQPLRLRSEEGSSSDLDSPVARADGPTPSSPLREKEQALGVQEALSKLEDPEAREILQLCFFGGLTFRQIGERTGLSYDQVRARYHAGLRRMEKHLKGLE
jgi:RNA polymerase sigma factor (sigma-70 family)